MMSTSELRLLNPPIVEAILDIGCDMPPGFNLPALEAAFRERLRNHYPKFRVQFIQEAKIETPRDATPQVSIRNAIQALQFLQEDEKQLVQIRTQGFSFNRLAPYTSLDDYLPEIEKSWRLFVDLARPINIRLVQLRYINRILLPTLGGRVQLEDYLKTGPRLPDEEKLSLASFLNQQAAIEAETGNQVTTVLTTQAPEPGRFPIIFDNCVTSVGAAEPEDWAWILTRILSLRSLKNRIFENTLTQRCLNLFQQQSESVTSPATPS